MGRFHSDEEGVVSTNWQSVEVAACIAAGEGQEPTWHAYHLTACIFHEGPTPHSGHYRAFLMGHAALLTAGNTEDLGHRVDDGDVGATTHQYVTDDNQRAEIATPSLMRVHEQNSYLLFYTRSAT